MRRHDWYVDAFVNSNLGTIVQHWLHGSAFWQDSRPLEITQILLIRSTEYADLQCQRNV